MSKVFDIIKKEEMRQIANVELIASENFVSDNILRALGSVLTNKYTEGYPPTRYKDRGRKGRYYGGCENYDELEEYCCNLWREVYGTQYHVNVQPHSGSQANMAAYAAFLKPGDTILAMSLNAGGHLTHSAPVSFVGNLYNVITYGVDDNGILDYEDIQAKIIDYRPKLIVFGASAYPREIDFGYLNDLIQVSLQICAEEDLNNQNFDINGNMITPSIEPYAPIIMVDMAHIAGLVAAGYHHTPFDFADVITTTTHKTLRGPRGGLIFCKPQYAEQVDKAVFPYCQGGSLMNVIAAKAVCAEEAQSWEFKDYINRVLVNCHAMADAFTTLGYNLVAGGTDNHMLLLDLTGTGITGAQLQEACDKEGITLNKNAIPNDPLPPSQASGVRIGTAAMTTKWYTAKDFQNVAVKIHKIIKKLQTAEQPLVEYDLDSIKIGDYPLDPNIYKDIEIWKNVTVYVSENTNTGEISLSWKRQPDTIDLMNSAEEEDTYDFPEFNYTAEDD